MWVANHHLLLVYDASKLSTYCVCSKITFSGHLKIQYWLQQGKTKSDINFMLGTSPFAYLLSVCTPKDF